MITLTPTELEGQGVRLEPLAHEHERELAAAATDGALWELWFTVVPAPGETRTYIETALTGQREGRMLPWAVRNLATGALVGSTRFHDVAANIDRVEIGYTWYAKSAQRTHINTTCKLLLLTHAFERVGCRGKPPERVDTSVPVCDASAMTAARKLEPAKAPSIDADASPLERVDESDGLAFREEWKAEIERRAEEIRSGKVQGIPVEEVEAEIDAEFGWG